MRIDIRRLVIAPDDRRIASGDLLAERVEGKVGLRPPPAIYAAGVDAFVMAPKLKKSDRFALVGPVPPTGRHVARVRIQCRAYGRVSVRAALAIDGIVIVAKFGHPGLNKTNCCSLHGK